MDSIHEEIIAKMVAHQERMEASMSVWQERKRPACKRQRLVWRGRSQPQRRW
jgi:hypothetical protein